MKAKCLLLAAVVPALVGCPPAADLLDEVKALVAPPPGPGDLDASFGSGGAVSTPIGLDWDYGRAVAVQDDGKIVVAGYYASASASNDFALVRYNRDGTLDTSFGGTGIATTQVSTGDDRATGLAIQPDEKIVVAGTSGGSFVVVRYTPTGALDSSFGTGGILTTTIAASQEGNGVALQPSDNKIVVAGWAGLDVAVIRTTTGGALDTAFDTDGKVQTDINGTDKAYAVAIQTDGKIVVGGSSSNDFCVVRYTTAGALDSTFDADGKVTLDAGSLEDTCRAILIQADGRIVLVGDRGTAGYREIVLYRLTTGGSLDATFGTAGKATTSIGGDSFGNAAFSDADGRIVVAGLSADVPSRVLLARFNTDGSLDSEFGDGGTVFALIGSAATARGVAGQADGKIVIAGETNSGSGAYDFLVARFHP
jgi:uncharacterized delta-60 repeat protein